MRKANRYMAATLLISSLSGTAMADSAPSLANNGTHQTQPVMVYVSNAESQDISVFRLSPADGTLQPLQTLGVGGTVMPMTISADKKTLYASIRSKPFRVAALSIDGKTGLLSERGSAPLPNSMANISLDKSGHYLFAASYGGNIVSISPLDANGVPKEATQVLPTPPMAHQITAAVGNKIVYASTLGGDRLLSFQFDAAQGKLTPDAEPAQSFPAKSGPRHFMFSADNRFVYVVDELDGRLHVLQRLGADTPKLQEVQTVSVVPKDFSGTPWAADLHLTPDNQFLYASERTSSTLTGFRVDSKNGTLTPIGTWPTEKQPRGFTISPDGRYLLAVGEKSNQLSVYRIDGTSGQLTLLNQYAVGKDPNWVAITQLP